MIHIIYYEHGVKSLRASSQMLLNEGFGCLSFNSFIPGDIVKISSETFELILSLKTSQKVLVRKVVCVWYSFLYSVISYW